MGEKSLKEFDSPELRIYVWGAVGLSDVSELMKHGLP
jgi:hypothetical protein